MSSHNTASRKKQKKNPKIPQLTRNLQSQERDQNYVIFSNQNQIFQSQKRHGITI